MPYYVQQLATYCLLQIAPYPENPQIPEQYLKNCTSDEFIIAFRQYREFIRTLLTDIRDTPSDFDLLCLEIDSSQHGRVSKNEARSIKSFQRIPKLLTILATAGIESDNGEIYLPIPKLRGIARANNLLEKLHDYGFYIEKSADTFSICYPDNPNFLPVLRTYASVTQNLLYADIRYLTANDKRDFHTPEDIIRLVQEEYLQKLISTIIEKFTYHRYYIKTEFAYNPARIRISKTKSAKEFMNILIERDNSVHLHIRLAHIEKYASLLHDLSENILKQSIYGRDCCQCGFCKEGSVEFDFSGQHYSKCSLICCGFHYTDIQPEDTESICKLIDAEISYC